VVLEGELLALDRDCRERYGVTLQPEALRDSVPRPRVRRTPIRTHSLAIFPFAKTGRRMG
jgi:hypothetical protein